MTKEARAEAIAKGLICMIPVNEPLEPEEVGAFIEGGYYCFENIMLGQQPSIAVPGQQAQQGLFNIWFRPASMLPQKTFIQALFVAEQDGCDMKTINWFSEKLLGNPWRVVRQRLNIHPVQAEPKDNEMKILPFDPSKPE